MSRLLGNAKHKVRTCVMYWNERSDDFVLGDICFNIQQAVEFGLKYLKELDGCNYMHTHNIKELLSDISDKYYNTTWFPIFSDNAKTITDWYTTPRYANDVYFDGHCVELVFPHVQNFISWLEDVDGTTSEVTIEGRVQKVLLKLNSTASLDKILELLPTSIKIMDDEMLFDSVKTALQLYYKLQL